jgi:hypothetical protein
VARRSTRRRVGFLALALLLLVAGAAGGYWYVGLGAPWPAFARARATPPILPNVGEPAGMAVTPALVAMLDSSSAAAPSDTVPHPSDSSAVNRPDAPPAADSGRVGVATGDSLRVPVDSAGQPADSGVPMPDPPAYGVLALHGLPRTARLSLDGAPQTGLVHRVDPGDRAIAVNAPGYKAFSVTVSVAAGDTVPVQVTMAKLPAPPVQSDPCAEEPPGPEYFSARPCYDTRPSPLRPPLVYVDRDLPAEPSPVQLLVKVSSEGRPMQILRGRRQTADAGLILRAIGFVRDSLQFVAASKAGDPIDAWARLTVRFRPRP